MLYEPNLWDEKNPFSQNSRAIYNSLVFKDEETKGDLAHSIQVIC